MHKILAIIQIKAWLVMIAFICKTRGHQGGGPVRGHYYEQSGDELLQGSTPHWELVQRRRKGRRDRRDSVLDPDSPPFVPSDCGTRAPRGPVQLGPATEELGNRPRAVPHAQNNKWSMGSERIHM